MRSRRARTPPRRQAPRLLRPPAELHCGGSSLAPCLGDLERALHAGSGMTGNGAEVLLSTFRERDADGRRLAGLQYRRLLRADLEVVPELAAVRHDEDHRPVGNLRLAQRELELLRGDLDRGRARGGLAGRGDRHNGESRSPCEQRYEDTQSHVSLSPTSEDWSKFFSDPALIVPEA